MRHCELVFLFLISACAGSQNTRSTIGGSEDIDIPWNDTKQRAARASAPQASPPPGVDVLEPDARERPGRLIDFDVKNTDLHDAFRLLAETADINIVVADSVQGRISLRVRQVGWQQVLQSIAKTKHLMLRQQGDIYFVQ